MGHRQRAQALGEQAHIDPGSSRDSVWGWTDCFVQPSHAIHIQRPLLARRLSARAYSERFSQSGEVGGGDDDMLTEDH